MTAADGRVLSVNLGQARPLRVPTSSGGRNVMSGIGKRGVEGDVQVRRLGLVHVAPDGDPAGRERADEQADPTVHGGIDKAVYAYPGEHYAFWRTVRAQAKVSLWDEALPPGFMGENLTLEGVAESDVWVGDLLRFPRCELAVAGPRQPCFKFNAVMGFSQASKLMAQSGWCGFYLAVRSAGTIAAGERFEIVPGAREVGIPELFRAQMRRGG
ncbi:MAG TPA: MOSC domain-containing protein [Methylibium sp.]|uniref:MOSC domain-containing protein n=1 Tax=Methylibium sp. TaxID=2067992 RepID=UPI002DB81632|nr:MOSC domain-containing protein [Methylibium sp.]HEU4458516.1 MOSC domain-containing protein [Methylibium sp.]